MGTTSSCCPRTGHHAQPRSRELYWKDQRRTDLLRFGVYATGYNWPFKGGAANGTDSGATRTLFPPPNTDLVANPNLKHNFSC